MEVSNGSSAYDSVVHSPRMFGVADYHGELVMPLYQILIPSEVDGEEIDSAYQEVWFENVAKLVGGITVLPEATGRWTSPDGKSIKENMLPVLLYCDPAIMERIMDFTLKFYDQETIMAFKISDHILIRNAPRKVIPIDAANKQKT